MKITVTAKEKTALDARCVPERPCRVVLEAAGLSVEETALAELFYKCPAPSGVADSVRYAIWALNRLPKVAEQLSPAAYYGTSRGDGDTPASRIEQWLGAAEREQEREGDDEPRLFAVLRKLLAWCQEYEKQHPYSPEYDRETKPKTRKKAKRSGTERVIVEAPDSAPELTVQVLGQQMSLL